MAHMAARLEIVHRPPATANAAGSSTHRAYGFLLGLIGLTLVSVAFIANLGAAGDVADGNSPRETLAWTFGLTTFAFGTIKFGIAIVLTGVLVRAWLRVEAMKAALPRLKGPGGTEQQGAVATRWGVAVGTPAAPQPLLIHRVAPKAWAPMLAMGTMLVGVGLVLAFMQAGTTDDAGFTTLGAWVQGVQFLGEAMLLGAISFLLGSILGALRSGGGEVQEALGVTVQTLRMPASAKLFIVLMMLGVMAGMAQFVGYVVATTVDHPAVWFAWLGPLRELSIGLLLLGIVMALYTIGTVLGFQFNRVRELVTNGS